MKQKEAVRQIHPNAFAQKDVDGFWWIWSDKVRGALNDARQPTRSAAEAWKIAAARQVG